MSAVADREVASENVSNPEVPSALPVTMARMGGSEIDVVVGVMKAKRLTDVFEIPRRDSRKKTGYQRDPSGSRVNRLAEDLTQKRVDLPTAILLNCRNFQPKKHLSEKDGYHFFDSGDEPLHVVDGQHRVLALEKLVESDPERWSDYEIPFVCMLGATEYQEMRQFYVVNSTAKSVRTDLAFDLLKQQADSDSGLMESLVERHEEWKVRGQTVVEELAKTPVWENRIRLPRDPKGRTTISSSGLASSLKGLLNSAFFGQLTAEKQARILDAFWRGVRGILPEAFEDPTDFTLQKGVGAIVMHSVLLPTLEYIRSKGKSVTDPDSFTEALDKALLKLEGDNQDGEPVDGADFWRTAPDGAAGSYSSSAGQRVLIARIRAQIPEVEIE